MQKFKLMISINWLISEHIPSIKQLSKIFYLEILL